MSLAINYLSKVTVAEHDGLVRQILGKLQASSISHEMFTQRLGVFGTRVNEEDVAYAQSQKDFNSDRLKKEDDLCDMYAKAVRAILSGHAEIPESESNYQLATELLQVFKDYKFSPSDTYTAEADKVRNMNQVFQTRLADLETLGVKAYWLQVVAHATNVEQLMSQRFDAIAAQSVGAMKTARANTDQALKSVYELLSAMSVMAPSAELTSLIAQLDAIESYAWQYYLGGKKPSGGGSNSGNGGTTNNGGTEQGGTEQGGTEQGGDTPGGDTPGGGGTGTITPDPGTGGGDTPGGGSDPGDEDDAGDTN
jgi:hypothetical protein